GAARPAPRLPKGLGDPHYRVVAAYRGGDPAGGHSGAAPVEGVAGERSLIDRVSSRVVLPSFSVMSRICVKPTLLRTRSDALFAAATVACTSVSPRVWKP